MQPSEYKRLFENEQTHWWFRGRRAIARALLSKYLPRRGARTRRILDAGCGTGGNLALLQGFGRVTAMDLSPLALSFAATRGRQPAQVAAHELRPAAPVFTRGSLLSLPFADESFDVVTAFDVLYHLWVEDDVAALRELCRVLKPGGLFLMTDSGWQKLESAHDKMNLARQRYEVPELRVKLAKAGLGPLKVSYANFLLLPLVLGYRTAQRLSGDAHEAKSDVAPVAPLLNRALETAYTSEARLLPAVDFPRGSSVVAVARKPVVS